jgi:hypothetical protein
MSVASRTERAKKKSYGSFARRTDILQSKINMYFRIVFYTPIWKVLLFQSKIC